jgi:hypothetical protein
MNNANGFWDTNEPVRFKNPQCSPQIESMWEKVMGTMTIEYRKEKKNIDYAFGRMIHMWVAGLQYDMLQPSELVDNYCKLNEKNTSQLRQFSRHQFGYDGLGFKFTPTRCGLISKSAQSLKNKMSSKQYQSLLTKDHIIGVTLVGWLIHNIIQDMLKDNIVVEDIVNYMVDEWLPDNLFLWAEANLTTKEHKSENLKRDNHTLQEKINLEHYTEAGVELIL